MCTLTLFKVSVATKKYMVEFIFYFLRMIQ